MAVRKKRKRQNPVSLHPLGFEEALAGLMQVKPEEKKAPAESERESNVEAEPKEPN